jgi:hypothetical protein
MRAPLVLTTSLLATCAIVLAACGGSDASSPPNPSGTDASTAVDASAGVDASTGPDAASPDANAPRPDAGVDAPADSPQDLVARLTALTQTCNVADNGKFSIHAGLPPTIDICRLNGAFFWSSSMNVDCDGQTTTQCNSSTDPAYQNDTSFHQSNGQPLDAATLPYVVIPLPSFRFDYTASGIQPGAVVAVIYNGILEYGVFGDEGPVDLLGEASYAMAKSVGVNPDPANGGVDSGALYIVFTGTGAVASPIEDHQAAVTLGGQLAQQLLAHN